jgi:hypothetical protein
MTKAAEEHRARIMEQTLAVDLTITVSESVAINLSPVSD